MSGLMGLRGVGMLVTHTKVWMSHAISMYAASWSSFLSIIHMRLGYYLLGKA